jgi:hypothetical protein
MASIEKYKIASGKPRYTVRWRAEGRTHEKTFQRADSAENFKREVEARRDQPDLVDPSRGQMKFGQYADAWLAQRTRADGRPLAPRTRELYQALLTRFIFPTFSRTALSGIRTEQVRR